MVDSKTSLHILAVLRKGMVISMASLSFRQSNSFIFNKHTIPYILYILFTLCALFSLTCGVYAGEAQGSTGCVRFIDEKGGAISNLNIIFDVQFEDDMNSPPKPFIDGSEARTDSNGEYIFTQEALGKKRFWVVNDQVEGNRKFYRCSINLTKEYEPQPFEFVLADVKQRKRRPVMHAGAHCERFLAASEIWVQDAASHSVKRYALDLPPASQNLPIPLKWE